MLTKLKKLFCKLFLSEKTVDYISGGKALPLPLEPEKENELIILTLQGDKSAREKLIEHNLRLVVYIAKKFESTGIELDDLISIGSIGLIKAINNYSLDKNIKLATFASRCIENEILMYMRKTAKTKNEVSFDEPLNTDADGNMLVLADILGTEDDGVYSVVESNIEKEILYKVFMRLDEREKQILKLRFGLFGAEEKTQKEIADMMNISQSYISRLEKKILLRLKKEMTKQLDG